MIEVTITDKMKETAKRKAEEMGELKNSMTGVSGNYIGFLGEEVAALVLDAKIENTYDYDMKVGKRTIDVKTKNSKLRPKPEYDCSIPAFNPHQKCDYYCFVRVNPDENKAYYLGVIKKEEFWSKAKFHKKNSKNKPGDWWRYKTDTYTVPISALKKGFREV